MSEEITGGGSGETLEHSGGKKKKGEQLAPDARARSLVDVVPKRPDFFEWLEAAFSGETQFPEKIHICSISGKQGERLGPTVWQIIYAPKESKPSREKLVALANEILGRCQRDCDSNRRTTVYGVHLAHYAREVDFYGRYTMRLDPSPVHGRQTANGVDVDDDPVTGQERFIQQVLSHQERMFEMYGGAFEGMLDRLDRIVERQDRRIESQDARIAAQADQLERALSMEADRAERREWAKLKVAGVGKALDFGLALAPPLLNQLVGKPVIPTSTSAESLTLQNFFKGLSEEQAAVVFGVFSDNNPQEQVRPGILSVDQARLLWAVAESQVGADELDRLLPGGPLAVTQEQVMRLLSEARLSLEQIGPIQLIFDQRMKRREGVGAPSGAAPTDPSPAAPSPATPRPPFFGGNP